ncbi:MAG: hypothetical protein ACI9C1_000126 [Candidatus Aldehydirespiratoraceae bacterium]|jgi:hypothetical protein
MSDDERLADQVMDLLVYAPIGLALEARQLLPKLAERGRGQIALTRLAGKIASDRGQGEARKLVDQVIAVAGTVLAGDDDDPAAADDDEPDLTGDDSALPVDGYDGLSAPQLLPFLPPLSADELDAILRYEQAHRSRTTVINRIRQLQG